MINPKKEHVISVNNHHMRVDYNPYEGRIGYGAATTVLSRGEVVIENGKFLGRPGRGRFLKRAARSIA